MQISIMGRTDKRTCIYTLMKMLQPMGKVFVVTSNRQYCRLLEDGSNYGQYQNITIFVTDDTADELWLHDEINREDYDHVILDNLYNEETDVLLYIQGAGVEVLDEDIVETFADEMITIHMGKGSMKGKNNVPYSKDLMANLETVEYYKKLVCPSPAMGQVLSKIMADKLGMSAKNLLKVVTKK